MFSNPQILKNWQQYLLSTLFRFDVRNRNNSKNLDFTKVGRISKAYVFFKISKIQDLKHMQIFDWFLLMKNVCFFPLQLNIFRMRFLKNRSLCRAWNYTGETTINVHPRMITEKWPSEKRVWHLYCTHIRFYHNEPEFQNFVQKLWEKQSDLNIQGVS